MQSNAKWKPTRLLLVLAAFAGLNTECVSLAAPPSEKDAAQTADSRHVAWIARHDLTISDPATALALALEAVPSDVAHPDRPLDRFPEGALYEALSNLRERVFLAGHTAGILTATFSPDGSRVLTRAHDHTVRLWDASTGKQLAVFGGADNWAIDGIFSPDGMHVATGSRDGVVRIWDTITGRQVSTLIGLSNDVRALSYSLDGTRISAGSSKGATRIWDTVGGGVVAEMQDHNTDVDTTSFSPDGSKILTRGNDDVHVWNAKTGQFLFLLHPQLGCVSGPCSQAAAFFPDGKRIAVLTARSLSIWDSSNGQKVTEAATKGFFADRMALSPDGSRIATAAASNLVQIWDATTGKEISTITQPSNAIALAFSPDGKRLVTGSQDHIAYVWDVRSASKIMTLTGHLDMIFAASFSADGMSVLTGSMDGSARIWSMQSAIRPIDSASSLGSASFSPDSKRIVGLSQSGIVQVLDADTGALVLELKALPDRTTHIALSPDGRLIATAGEGRITRLWDSTTGRQIRVFGDYAQVISDLSFSHDGSLLAAASPDRTVRVWETSTGTTRSVMHANDKVSKTRFSPDDSLLVTTSHDAAPSNSKPPQVWAVKTGRELAVLEGHEDVVFDLAFSPDGAKILTASRDKTARIWEASTGRQLAVLTGHTLSLTSGVFSPDGSRALTASVDATARIWDATSGRLLQVLRHKAGIGGLEGALYSPDGSLIVVRGPEGRINLWDANTAQQILDLGLSSFDPIISPDGSRIFSGSQIWPLLKGQALVDRACKVLPRSLTNEQRRQFFLDLQPQLPRCGVAPLDWIPAGQP